MQREAAASTHHVSVTWRDLAERYRPRLTPILTNQIIREIETELVCPGGRTAPGFVLSDVSRRDQDLHHAQAGYFCL
jgi:hypothetical protein